MMRAGAARHDAVLAQEMTQHAGAKRGMIFQQYRPGKLNLIVLPRHEDFRFQALQHPVPGGFRAGRVACQRKHGITCARPHRCQRRDQQCAHAVAREIGALIARIGAVLELMSGRVFHQRRLGHAQQRPDEGTASQRDARQTAQSGAAQQPQQNGFNLIVGMMRGGNSCRARTALCGEKKTIARLTRDTLAAQLCVGACRDQRDLPAAAQLRDPGRIVSALGAHAVVEVRGAHLDAQACRVSPQQVQQNDGIDAAG